MSVKTSRLLLCAVPRDFYEVPVVFQMVSVILFLRVWETKRMVYRIPSQLCVVSNVNRSYQDRL